MVFSVLVFCENAPLTVLDIVSDLMFHRGPEEMLSCTLNGPDVWLSYVYHVRPFLADFRVKQTGVFSTCLKDLW